MKNRYRKGESDWRWQRTAWESALLLSNKTFSFRFSQKGLKLPLFFYFCHFSDRQWMRRGQLQMFLLELWHFPLMFRPEVETTENQSCGVYTAQKSHIQLTPYNFRSLETSLLTVLSWVSSCNFGFRTPSLMVPCLDLNLIGYEGWSAFHHKWVSFNDVLLPFIFHILSPVAHPVLQTRSIVLDG